MKTIETMSSMLKRLVQLYEHQHLVTVKQLITEWFPETNVKRLRFCSRYVAIAASIGPSTYIPHPSICPSPWAEILAAIYELEHGFEEDEKVLLASAREAWYERYE